MHKPVQFFSIKLIFWRASSPLALAPLSSRSALPRTGKCFEGVHVYDPIRDRWTAPSAVGVALPTPRQFSAHVVVGSEVLVYGGCSVKGAVSGASLAAPATAS